MRVAGQGSSRRGGLRSGSGGKSLPLLLDEPDVVRQVAGGMQDQLPQRDQPALIMNGGSPPRLGRDELEGAGDEGQLFFEVAVVVAGGLGG